MSEVKTAVASLIGAAELIALVALLVWLNSLGYGC